MTSEFSPESSPGDSIPAPDKYEPVPGSEHFGAISGIYFAIDKTTGEEIFREPDSDVWGLY